MNDFFPSRRVVAFVLVPVVTILSVWGVVKFYPEPTFEADVDTLAVTIAEGNRQFQEQDTDNDGLRDWEEFLYQTDPENPDTDGDGALDGAEVNRGYDPLVSGNGTSTDEIAGQSPSGFAFYKEDPNLSKTDLLARDIFTAYAELKDTDALEVATIRDQAIANAISDSTLTQETYIYTIDDVRVVGTTSANARAYKQSYQSATNQLRPIQFGELELFYRYIQEGDVFALQTLQSNRDAYVLFAEQLAGASVPEDISGVHLELLNNVMILATSLDQMLKVEDDPLVAYVHAQKLLEDEALLYKNVQAISLYFANNGL